MGLFGFVGKAVGKLVKTVARTGLSVATQGVSDRVFQGIAAKKAARQQTNQGLALAARLGMDRPMKARVTKRKSLGYDIHQLAAARTRKQAKMSYTQGRKSHDKAVGFSGGLDLKRISEMWREQDKPGSWIEFVKANSDVRKPVGGGKPPKGARKVEP